MPKSRHPPKKKQLEFVQTKLEIHELRLDLQEMMQQFKSVLVTADPNQENKRTTAAIADDNLPSEKRRDVRATPGKSCLLMKWIFVIRTCILQPWRRQIHALRR
jgi:hypothetical protein